MRFRLLPRFSRPLYFTVFAALLLITTQSCSSGSDEPTPLARCVTLDENCSLLYQPVFSEIHRRTLAATCAEPGTSCHSNDGRRGGLALEDIDEAYQLLLDPERERVVPGDPECSRIMVRLEHTGSSVMPPGDPLPEAERCTIATWIRNGALRD
ncbi:MAG: c-type cytochrome domain-containing protein [Polyangiaceae bacterium]